MVEGRKFFEEFGPEFLKTPGFGRCVRDRDGAPVVRGAPEYFGPKRGRVLRPASWLVYMWMGPSPQASAASRTASE